MPPNTKNATKLEIMTYFDSPKVSIAQIAKTHSVHYTTIHKAINRLNFRYNRMNSLTRERRCQLIDELESIYNNKA